MAIAVLLLLRAIATCSRQQQSPASVPRVGSTHTALDTHTLCIAATRSQLEGFDTLTAARAMQAAWSCMQPLASALSRAESVCVGAVGVLVQGV